MFFFPDKMACLSSTTLTKQLTNLKFEDFCNDVNSHLDSNGTDTVSALKGIILYSFEINIIVVQLGTLGYSPFHVNAP